MHRQERYVGKNSRIYEFSHCELCGVAYGGKNHDHACPVSVCKACGTPQCLYNGLGNGTCSVCYHGLLPGWSGTDRQCGYKGCRNEAVARAPRVGFCCEEHLDRPKLRGKSLRQSIAEYLAQRDDTWRLTS